MTTINITKKIAEDLLSEDFIASEAIEKCVKHNKKCTYTTLLVWCGLETAIKAIQWTEDWNALPYEYKRQLVTELQTTSYVEGISGEIDHKTTWLLTVYYGIVCDYERAGLAPPFSKMETIVSKYLA